MHWASGRACGSTSGFEPPLRFDAAMTWPCILDFCASVALRIALGGLPPLATSAIHSSELMFMAIGEMHGRPRSKHSPTLRHRFH